MAHKMFVKYDGVTFINHKVPRTVINTFIYLTDLVFHKSFPWHCWNTNKLYRFFYTLAEGIMISVRSLQRSEGDVFYYIFGVF